MDLDISNFFNEVAHTILMKLVREVVKDRRVLRLLRGWLTAGVMEESNVRYETSGTPQGGVISPLRTREEAEAALQAADDLLSRMKLRLSPEKMVISSFQEVYTAPVA